MLIHVSDWLAAHNDWSGWFATTVNSFSPMCNLNFSFMGGVGKQAHWYLNFDVTHWYLLLRHIPRVPMEMEMLQGNLLALL